MENTISKKHRVKLHYSFLKVMTGFDLSSRRIPIMEIESIEKGPVVVITACIHGDETGGTVVVHELFRLLKRNLRRGKIVAFPLLNPFGFENKSRRISISNEDLNRSFPGEAGGTFAQRLAFLVMDRITQLKPSIVLDLHNDWNKSIPYVVIDKLEDTEQLSVLHHYARKVELPAIQESERISGSFSFAINAHGIPALTLELGESLLINERNVNYGIGAVLNILDDLNMIGSVDSHLSFDLPAATRNKILTYSSSPLCTSSGIIRFLKKPGQIVKRGDKLARVYNAFGKLTETVVSTNDGIILGHNDYAMAFPGSPVMAFGLFE